MVVCGCTLEVKSVNDSQGAKPEVVISLHSSPQGNSTSDLVTNQPPALPNSCRNRVRTKLLIFNSRPRCLANGIQRNESTPEESDRTPEERGQGDMIEFAGIQYSVVLPLLARMSLRTFAMLWKCDSSRSTVCLATLANMGPVPWTLHVLILLKDREGYLACIVIATLQRCEEQSEERRLYRC